MENQLKTKEKNRKIMDNLEDIKNEYELDENQNLEKAQLIFDIYTHEKQPSDRPFAVIVFGQPGAGKSGLMGYSSTQFPSAVALDIDDLRTYHPKAEEVKQKHPQIYEAVTGKFATDMMHILTPVLIDKKYNLVLHKTRGDDLVINDTIIPLQNEGYDVVLRVMAVHELESKLSALKRSLDQRDRFGVCRWVEIPYHNRQYNGVVDISQRIEDEKIADAVEVYVRGEEMFKPGLVYSKLLTDKIRTNPNMYTADGREAIADYNTEQHASVRKAINIAREEAVPSLLAGYEKREKELQSRFNPAGREHEFMDEIKDLVNNLQKTKI